MQATVPGMNRTGAAVSHLGAEAMTRAALREVVAAETQLRKRGTEFVDEAQDGKSPLAYRKAVNADGSPSENISATYSWTPGTELMREQAETIPA